MQRRVVESTSNKNAVAELTDHLKSIGISHEASAGFSNALVADGFDTPRGLGVLSLAELRDDFGFMRGHCRLVEQSRSGGSEGKVREVASLTGLPVVVAAPAEEELPSPAPAPADGGGRALGSLQVLHEAALAAELQRRQALEAELQRVAAEKVSATEALAAATSREQAMQQRQLSNIATWEQKLAQTQATLATVQQELRHEKHLRTACEKRARQLEIEVEAMRTAHEAITFTKVTADVDRPSLPGRQKNVLPAAPGRLPDQLPGEHFIVKRCTQKCYTNPGESSQWKFLTNYGRVAEVDFATSNSSGESGSFHGKPLAGKVVPLSKEYVELAYLMNYTGLEQRTVDGRESFLEEDASMLEGLVSVYKKYHPSAAAQFEKQRNAY